MRSTDNDKDFTSSDLIEVDGKQVSDVVAQAIKNDESIEATDASVKDKTMAGA